jgi:DNA-binding winged helix-turn-helix (wHTH) protein
VTEKSELPVRPLGLAMGTGLLLSETMLNTWTLAEFDTLVLPRKNDPILEPLPPVTSMVAWAVCESNGAKIGERQYLLSARRRFRNPFHRRAAYGSCRREGGRVADRKRVNAFLRRRNSARENVCRFGGFALDSAARKLFRNGEDVDLTAREFRLLLHLASRPGRALTQDSILDAVWGSSVFVTPRSIDRCVTTLRAKIEPIPRGPLCIQTIRDIGYRFEPE